MSKYPSYSFGKQIKFQSTQTTEYAQEILRSVGYRYRKGSVKWVSPDCIEFDRLQLETVSGGRVFMRDLGTTRVCRHNNWGAPTRGVALIYPCPECERQIHPDQEDFDPDTGSDEEPHAF